MYICTTSAKEKSCYGRVHRARTGLPRYREHALHAINVPPTDTIILLFTVAGPVFITFFEVVTLRDFISK